MKRIFITLIINIGLIVSSFAFDKGIFISHPTIGKTSKFKALIKEAKSVGINTFIVDLSRIGKRYDRNIKYLLDQNMKYVVRIVMFPGGGNKQQIKSLAIRKKKLKLIQHAVQLGASAVQLDYIRYSIKNRNSKQNARDIKQVVDWFKQRTKAPLQVAVFGETAYRASNRIGQDLKLLSSSVDTIAPMLYPSHFKPKRIYSYQPYNTIKNALDALRIQFNGNVSNKVITYIETYNYRRKKMPAKVRRDYIQAQIQAVEDSGFDGWYAWSANNYYKPLFDLLKQQKQ